MPIMTLFLATVSFSKDDSTQWVVLCVGVLATLYLVMRGRAKRQKDPLERRPAMGISQQRQIERDMGQLMVEMLDTARQMTAQLDTRAARIEVLMKEADAKLAALKAAAAGLAMAPAQGHATIAAEPPIPACPPVALPEPRPRAAKSDNLELPPDPRHADVYRMADQGNSPNEIARQLNRPHGEVELILALRPQ
jgi:DNA-binding NarL/FixJ family response regulator